MSSTAAALRAQAQVLLALADEIEHSTPSTAPSEFIGESEAIKLGGFTSKRALRDAVRAAGVQAFGTTHARSFKREDFVRFLEKRVLRVQAPPVTADRIERRAAQRLASRRVL